jgi:hypothetical protein
LKVKKTAAMPNARPKSPTRFTSIALIDDFPACIRLFQKPIKRKEAKPIPSQPRNIKTKLSPVTKISIKNVNSER